MTSFWGVVVTYWYLNLWESRLEKVRCFLLFFCCFFVVFFLSTFFSRRTVLFAFCLEKKAKKRSYGETC